MHVAGAPRGWKWAALISLSAVLFLASAPLARADKGGKPDKHLFVVYSGKIDNKYPAAYGGPGAYYYWGHQSVTLQWIAQAYFPNQAAMSKGVSWQFTYFKGSLDEDNKGAPNPTAAAAVENCSAKLSLRPSFPATDKVTTYLDAADNHYKLSTAPPLNAFAVASNDSNPSSWCSVNPALASGVGKEQWAQPNGPGAPGYASYWKAWSPHDSIPVGLGPYTTRFDDPFNPKNPPGASTTLSSSILATGHGYFPPFLSPEQLKELKAFYGHDLKLAIPAAEPYCLNYLGGLGTFGTGVLLTAGGFVGPILAIAGTIQALALQPFCIATIKRIASDYTFAHDPPDHRINQVARPARLAGLRLPSCAKFAKSTRALCRKLEPAEQALVAAAQKVASIAAAAATTINRYSTAVTQLNASAAATQSAQLRSLTAKDRTAVGAETRAGRRYAHILLSAHLAWKFTAPQSSRALAAVLYLLNKRHLTRAELAPFAGNTLTPRAFDVLHGLHGL